MKERLISIVVPVYNTEKYLAECVESILGQTCRNIELMLVDDGSTDSSAVICDEYASSDNRVKVLHQANGGHTAARKAGVAMASGDYICFVDSDDTIELDVIEKGMTLFDEGIEIVAMESNEDRLCSAQEYGTSLLQWHNVHLVGKLFRRHLLVDTDVFDIPREITIAEDLVTNIRALKYLAGNVRMSSIHKYHYRPVEGSMSRSTRVTAEYDLKILGEVTKALDESKLDLSYGFATFSISILKHLICDRYTFDQAWAEDLKRKCEGLELDALQKTVLTSVNHHALFPVVRIMVLWYKGMRRTKTTIKSIANRYSSDRINY